MLDILKHRKINFIILSIFIIFSLYFLIFSSKNYGIDMTGGTQSEYSYNNGNINLENIIKKLEDKKDEFNKINDNILNSISVYQVTGEQKIVVEVGYNHITDEIKGDKIKNNFKDLVSNLLLEDNPSFNLHKYTNIGQSFGEYIKKTAILTLAISLVGITIYVGYAFFGVTAGIPALSFAIIVLITQFIDVIVASGIYVFFGKFFLEFKVDTFFITALLTILGYSINNTIVVFDRVRENIKKLLKTKKLYEIINISINESIKRSIYTSLTVIFVLITIFFAGPETLKGFMLVMMIGVLFGIFSSLTIAGALLYEFNKNKELKIEKKVKLTAEDKIVV
ncbi:hypothetical protein H3C61_03860 [Candidatus Gracilibacteria bacterium]|nr:hypothetical protein [Candidatus Gracilibacteria bacterium]